MRIIDLRSDTFSLASTGMRAAMAEAREGDDYYGEDPSVNRLQDYCRELFEVEAALFTTTGMLSNLLAVGAQTQPGDEVVTASDYHVNLYESAQHAAFNHVVLNARDTAEGILNAELVQQAIESKPRDAVYAQVRLVVLENTIANRQGRIFPYSEILRLGRFSAGRGIRAHLDGARLFNAHIATGVSLAEYARAVDTVSVCFSKGLGAPVGSMLLGTRDTIERARRLRMWHGSGFHQAGFCAEAAYYALTHQLSRIAEDHELARLLAERLAAAFPIDPETVATNMVFLPIAGGLPAAKTFSERCREQGVLVYVCPPGFIRMVVCRNVSRADILRAAEVLKVARLEAEHQVQVV